MITFDGPEKKVQLPDLLEGYFFGLGEVCHSLFGEKGEVAMYYAIGSYFLDYIKNKMGIEFREKDPWQRYCDIIRVFTSYGFYSHVELDEIGPKQYWMLETNQYAGGVWEDQGAWDRGTPPCPLWSIILHSLSEINQTIILDSVSYNEKCNGYESTFHFEETPKTESNVLEIAKNTIREVLLPICMHCKKIRDGKGNWIKIESYINGHFKAQFSHSICPECAETYHPDMDLYDY